MRSYFLCFNYSARKFRQTLIYCCIVGLTLVPLLKIIKLKCLRHFKIVILRYQRKICCLWDNCRDFCNFEESLCEGMLFDIKNWACYWKGVFAQFFGDDFFHNLPNWINGSSKSVPYATYFFCYLWSTKSLKPLYL